MRKRLGTRSSSFTGSAIHLREESPVTTPLLSAHKQAWRGVLVLLGTLLVCAIAFAMWDVLQLDNSVSGYWGNSTGFALKEHAFWGVAIYKFERALGWVCMLLLLWMVFKPPMAALAFHSLPQHRRWFMLAAVIAALLLIQWFKRRSLTSCPWDYQVFGGIAQDISHWRFGQPDGGPGHCFPAGHPSAGFAFLAVPIFLMLSSPRFATWLSLAALAMGAILGLTQIARGAHFVSHVLWSAWWCAAAALMMLVVCLAWEHHRSCQTQAPA